MIHSPSISAPRLSPNASFISNKTNERRKQTINSSSCMLEQKQMKVKRRKSRKIDLKDIKKSPFSSSSSLSSSSLSPFSSFCSSSSSIRRETKKKSASFHSRSSHRSHAVGSLTASSGLYELTRQLLLGCYIFVGFHVLLLQFFPSVFTQLRYPPLVAHPLLLLPPQGHLFGRFFSFINGSIEHFVLRGVLGSVVLICLLHLLRAVLHPFTISAVARSSSELLLTAAGSNATEKDITKRAGALRRLLRTAWCTEIRFQRRREQLCAYLLAVVCLCLTVIQSSSFIFGGWTLKAIGFPDIYLAAIFKPGGLWGNATAAEVAMQYSDISPFPPQQLKQEIEALEPTQNKQLLLLVVLFGFALDTWGQYLQIKAIRRYLSKKCLCFFICLFTVVMSFAAYNLAGAPSCNSKDNHWVDFDAERGKGHFVEADGAYLSANPPILYSTYVEMRDGVRLAADVYLPFSIEKEARLWSELQHKQMVIRLAAEKVEASLANGSNREKQKKTEHQQHQKDKHEQQQEQEQGNEHEPQHEQRKLQEQEEETQGNQHEQEQEQEHEHTHEQEDEKELHNNKKQLLSFLRRVEAKLKEEENHLRSTVPKLPVYLEITRYNRRSEHFWPFTLLSIWRHPRGASLNVWSWQTQQFLVANQYAVVVVDTRGSGASFGYRSVDLGEDELLDAEELVQWSRDQWFSSSKIAAGGLSYDGMLGLSIAARGKVDAVLSLFSPIDIMNELVAPGGFFCHSFLNDYTGLTTEFERNGSPWRHMLKSPLQFPFHVLLGFLFSFGGSSGVIGFEAELPLAILSHKKNWKMTEAVSGVQFYDDAVSFGENLKAQPSSFGITPQIMETLAQQKVSLLAVGGFCDSATARGAIRLFSSMQKNAPESRPQLILGNWSHGGRRSCDPFGGSFSCFESDLYKTILRFFDCRLKKKCWGGVEEEMPVHYWQTGTAEWREALTFPPRENMKNFDLRLTDKRLSDVQLEEGPEEAFSVRNEGLGSLFEVYRHGLEHTLHDVTQKVQHYANMLELQEEARVSADLLRSASLPSSPAAAATTAAATATAAADEVASLSSLHAAPKRIHKKERRPSKLSQLLSGLLLAFLPQRQANNERNLKQLFNHDFNAHLMQLPPLPDAAETNAVASKQTVTTTQAAAAAANKRTETAAATSANSSQAAAEAEAAVANSLTAFQAAERSVDYEVEYLSSSGEYSRWPIAQHPFRLFINYGNRLFLKTKQPEFSLSLGVSTDEDKEREPFSFSPFTPSQLLARPLSFLSQPLERDLQMVGSAFLNLFIKAKHCNEISLFAYLEDVDVAAGFSHYVTEAQVLASNRPSEVRDDLPVGSYGRVLRPFSRKSYKPIEEDEEVNVSVNFEPTAWTFKKGHSLRLLLTGSDLENFQLNPAKEVLLPSHWKVLTYSAFLSIPLYDHPSAQQE